MRLDSTSAAITGSCPGRPRFFASAAIQAAIWSFGASSPGYVLGPDGAAAAAAASTGAAGAAATGCASGTAKTPDAEAGFSPGGGRGERAPLRGGLGHRGEHAGLALGQGRRRGDRARRGGGGGGGSAAGGEVVGEVEVGGESRS